MKPYFSENGINIYHGDCREILPALPGADLLLTDPPYSTGRNQGEFRASGNIAVSLHIASEKVERALIFSGASSRSIEFIRSSIRALQHNRILCWQNGFSRCVAVGPWSWDIVLIHFFGKAAEWHGVPLSSLIADPGYRDENGHRAAVPVEVMEHLYRPFAPASIIDPFCGSGASLLAVQKWGGTGTGIEIEERYCELAAKRLGVKELQR